MTTSQQISHSNQSNHLSSPLCSETEDSEIITQFIEFLKDSSSFRIERQHEQLDIIKAKLIDEEFDIDGIYKIPNQQWADWEFKLGMLVKIQRQITRFKAQRKRT